MRSKFYCGKSSLLLLTGGVLTLAFPFSSLSQSFTRSELGGDTSNVTHPTRLRFGPDGRLYVSEQSGLIKALTVVRNGPNSYQIVSTAVINLIQNIPNHNDDGTLAPSLTTRQVTGLLVTGTAANPLIYVTSSDPRNGNGPPFANVDTNSGIISLLSWDGSAWSKLDLVRGLPRSATSHSTNGLALDQQTNTLYVAQGGMTNAGSPSEHFQYYCDYALSGCILSVNLTAINAMPTQGSGNNAFKYDLPTLDDPNRGHNPDGSNINDPFGGDFGLNQAKIVPGGPVQVYATGFRNPYSVLITTVPGKARRMYTIDNGRDNAHGGFPLHDGSGNATNNYDPNQTGQNIPYNDVDQLHYIGNLDTYTAGTYSGGHPDPIRANPTGAGLYTDAPPYNGTTAVWRTSTSGPNPLPSDWPPVPANMAHPIEGNFLQPGVADTSILTFHSSTDGIAEYTASNFVGTLKGAVFAASYSYNGPPGGSGINGFINRINFTADGTDVTNAKSPTDRSNQDPLFDNNLNHPVDIMASGDNDPFPGTMWVGWIFASYIYVYEPSDYGRAPLGNKDTKTISQVGTTVTITIDSFTGYPYQLQHSNSLTGSFTNMGSPQSGNTGTTLTFTDPSASSPAGFYRIVIGP